MDIILQACSYRSEVWQLGIDSPFCCNHYGGLGDHMLAALPVSGCSSREQLAIQHTQLCNRLKQFLFDICQKGPQFILTILTMPSYFRVRVYTSQQSVLLSHRRLAHLLYSISTPPLPSPPPPNAVSVLQENPASTVGIMF